MRAPLLVFALVSLALAGCSDSGDGDRGGASTGGTSGGHSKHGTEDAATHLLAPTWQVGQWWTLASEQTTGDFTHVVSADKGNDWLVDTDNADIAFFDARFDISFLGQVRKADLAGSQGSARVEFFQFPLTPGKSWKTIWDGLDVSLNVTGIADGKATIEAQLANGTLYAKYTYEDKLGYFRDYAFYAPDGVTVGFAAKVTGSGLGFTGELTRWALDNKFEVHGTIPGANSQNFQVEAGFTDVWVDIHVSCTTGGVSVTVAPPNGAAEQRGFTASGPCPVAADETASVSAPVAEEQWGVVLASAPPTQGNLDITVIARTATTFKAGAAP